jgi:hypothetical protein
VVVIEPSLKNEFVANAKVGTLLIITGRVENKFNKARSHIQVSVDVLGIDKNVIKSDSVYCGNIIKMENLLNDEIGSIKKTLMKADGQLRTNVNIKPGGVVPFMVVFADLPGSVKEFRVKVMGSEPVRE